MSTVPWYLRVRDTGDAQLGQGVYTTVKLLTGTTLGRYTGHVTRDRPLGRNDYIFQVNSERGRLRALYFINGKPIDRNRRAAPFDVYGDGTVVLEPEEQSSNWTRFVNSVSPGSVQGQNVEYQQVRGRIHLVTTRAVEAGEQLLASYGDSYFLANVRGSSMEDVGLDVDHRSAVLEEILGEASSNDGNGNWVSEDMLTAQVYEYINKYAENPARMRIRALRERTEDGKGEYIGFTIVDYGEEGAATVAEVFTVQLKNAGAVREVLLRSVEEAARVAGRTYLRAGMGMFTSVEEAEAHGYNVLVDVDGEPLGVALLTLDPPLVLELHAGSMLEQELGEDWRVLIARTLRTYSLDEQCMGLRRFTLDRFTDLPLEDVSRLHLWLAYEGSVVVGIVVSSSNALQYLCVPSGATQYDERRMYFHRQLLLHYVHQVAPHARFSQQYKLKVRGRAFVYADTNDSVELHHLLAGRNKLPGARLGRRSQIVDPPIVDGSTLYQFNDP